MLSVYSPTMNQNHAPQPLDLALSFLRRDADEVKAAQNKFNDRAAHMMTTIRPNLDRIAAAYKASMSEVRATSTGDRTLFSWVSRWPTPTAWNQNTNDTFRLVEVTAEQITVRVKEPRPGGMAESVARIPVKVLDMTNAQIKELVLKD